MIAENGRQTAKTHNAPRFAQYPGLTTGARPICDGRMNLKVAPRPEELDLER